MMKGIIDICKLIRLPYLFVAAFLAFATRILIISPILAINNHSVQLPLSMFGILCFSIILLIAAGYIINDYFDTRDDRLTRPDDTIVGRSITRRSAIKLHTILNIVAIALAIYVSYSISYIKLATFFALASGLLWFYSTSYKRHLILGKIVISAMIAFIPIVVLLYEIPLLNSTYSEFMRVTGVGFTYLLDWVGFFSILVFFSSLIINLTKDLIKKNILGEEETKLKVRISIAISYIALILAMLFLSIKIFNVAIFAKYYLIILILLPSVYSLYKLLAKPDLKALKMNYNLSKLICIAVMLFCLFIPYIFKNNLI